MNEGRILHCDPSESWRRGLAFYLEGSPHQVVQGAGSLEESLEAIESIASGELDANLIVMSVTVGAGRILHRIRELDLPVKTMVVSGYDNATKSHELDVNTEVTKRDIATEGRDALIDAIDALPEPDVKQTA